MGKGRKLRSLLLVTFACLFAAAGCVSLSNYQTAEVLKAGEADIGVGITATSVGPTDEAVTDDLYEDITYTMVEFLWRYGISERFDVGGKIYSLAPFIGLTFDVKYQIIDGEGFDAAIDLGAGAAGTEVDNSDNTYFDYFGALLFTFAMSENASVTLSPKILARDINTDNLDETDTIVGGTITLQLGQEGKMNIYPEVGYYASDEADFVHYGLGLKW